MSIEDFVNPQEETVEDQDDDILQDVIEQYSQLTATQDDSDEDEEPLPAVKISDALRALATLKLYEEQQEVGNKDFILQLEQAERVIQTRLADGAKQQRIERYFGAKTSTS